MGYTKWLAHHSATSQKYTDTVYSIAHFSTKDGKQILHMQEREGYGKRNEQALTAAIKTMFTVEKSWGVWMFNKAHCQENKFTTRAT
jgi:hypothetical protein